MGWFGRAADGRRELPLYTLIRLIVVGRVPYRCQGKLSYTDYRSLLKFTDGWKIAAKVYQAHQK